jgi:hypothetical protein
VWIWSVAAFQLAQIRAPLKCNFLRRRLSAGKGIGAWLTVMPSINGTKLAAQEFRDKLLIH